MVDGDWVIFIYRNELKINQYVKVFASNLRLKGDFKGLKLLKMSDFVLKRPDKEAADMWKWD